MNDTEVNGSVNGNYTDDDTSPLSIIIVGAGIGGLSAAIFLRQQGHHVTLLEQSRFANELGAAVHLAPNANGLVRRMGIYAEKSGANPTLSVTQRKPDGSVIFSADITQQSDMWQHPWLLAHRVHLHSELKEKATSKEGLGPPAELRISAKVVQVDTNGVVTLASGEQIRGDVVVGADGVHSKARSKLPGAENISCFGSGKSAFRFLMARKMALENPATKKFAEKKGDLNMFMGRDRRVVIYPTFNDELLNFVCIHPTSESEVKQGEGEAGDWHQEGHQDKLLEVFKDFEPALLKLLEMADKETLKVWELLDMEQLPAWTDGRLVLIGDAAHPFTPHQGQGAGQAIEDAASLAVILSRGVPRDEIPERLKLYENCRYERASRIQEYSRVAGADLGNGPPLDINEYTDYNFGHDEWDHSTQMLRKWLWARNPNLYWRMPISFGPMPGPRQRFDGRFQKMAHSTFVTASIKIKTSRTLLQNLLPTASFKFKSPATVAYATFSVTTLDKMDWLGGKGYTHFGLYAHGVQYTKKNGEEIVGTFLPILFESLTDPIVSGREELGMPKLYCALDVNRTDNAYHLQAGREAGSFCDMVLDDLKKVDPTPADKTAPGAEDQGILAYKYIPKVGSLGSPERGQTEIEYPTFVSFAEEAAIVERKVVRTMVPGKSSIKFDARDWEVLPTLHHIVARLAELPVYDIVDAKVVEGTGVPDVSCAIRIE